MILKQKNVIKLILNQYCNFSNDRLEFTKKIKKYIIMLVYLLKYLFILREFDLNDITDSSLFSNPVAPRMFSVWDFM